MEDVELGGRIMLK